MGRYIKIGGDIVNLDSIARITLMANQSGLSDRLIIDCGGSPMVVDSTFVGKEHLRKIIERFEQMLEPEDWNAPQISPAPSQPLFLKKSA